ncbi:kinetochore protein NDC80 homolog [Wolffia australiana]
MRGGRIPKNRSVAATPARKARLPSAGPSSFSSRRESDASLCSSRPSLAQAASSSSSGLPAVSDKAYQACALRAVNAYLSSVSSVALKPPLPSARDIAAAFNDVLARLDWPCSGAPVLEDDLPSLLAGLRCPVKLSKSVLKAPGTPHSWPPLLAALHWLVQLARARDAQSSSSSSPCFSEANTALQYLFHSYDLFMAGEDDAVDALDSEQLRLTRELVAGLAAAEAALAREAAELERAAEAARSGPSPREAAERERGLLRDDMNKFDVMIESWREKLRAAEKLARDKEAGLEAKIAESRRISEENEELRAKVAAQVMNVRDAERMEKELRAVERDVAEAEIGRNVLEEKSWELDADKDRKFKELESLVEQANQAIRRLKLGCDFQYALNAEGSSASEVLGTAYKTVLKTFLREAADETKKNSVAKWEEKMSLQQQSREKSLLLNEKKERLAALQKKIAEADARSIRLKKEVDDHVLRCSADAEKAVEERQTRERQIVTREEEANNYLKECELELEEAVMESEEEVQKCAEELVALIDGVAEYKEFMESTVARLLADLSETAQTVVNAHKAFLSAKLVSAAQHNAGLSGSKRSRLP